jgi:hypothetical protein
MTRTFSPTWTGRRVRRGLRNLESRKSGGLTSRISTDARAVDSRNSEFARWALASRFGDARQSFHRESQCYLRPCLAQQAVGVELLQAKAMLRVRRRSRRVRNTRPNLIQRRKVEQVNWDA